MGLKRPDPQNLVIFGASGDLTARKAMPALYNLFCDELLPEKFAVVGFARSSLTDDEFRQKSAAAVAIHSRSGLDKQTWQDFERHLSFVSGSYDDTGAMEELAARLEKMDAEFDMTGRRLFYCATPPSTFPAIAGGLGAVGLNEDARIVVEKPFGSDPGSAKKLNETLHGYFDEKQIFRIDHYLGKETVQNILVFRFANGMFEPIWNARYVSAVFFEVAESVGIEGRGSFYEEAGALRDIVQNHMMQLVATVAMEPPASFQAEYIRDEKVKLLRSLRRIEATEVVRGQYTEGEVNGRPAIGYREEKDVDPESFTETFVAMRAQIENWRWAGVPFFLRTGKRMPVRATTITVMFHDAPHALFEESGMDRPEPNHLTIRIQPDEGITITFDAKLPGPEMKISPVNMHFDYDESFRSSSPEAYERLLHDAMLGDATLFTRADEIERSWEIMEEILEKTPPKPYPAGSWGPPEADELVAPGRWHLR